MAKKTAEQIQAKKDENARLVDTFKEMPIDEWAAYIKKNAPTGAKNRKYRVCAKKALSLENMKAYIDGHAKNLEKEKEDFKKNTWGILYEKDEKNKPIKDKPLLDKNGKPQTKQSIVYAVDYFTKKYLDGLLVIEKKTNPFEDLANW
jgi:hypothetical protein